LIDFAGLCGIAFCVGAGAALCLKDSHSWTIEAIAGTEAKPQVVNRSRKDDRLQATVVDAPRSANPQDGFGTWEVGGALIAVITVRGANGRLVFELDPLRRTTVIAKREDGRVPFSGRHIVPKSRVAPMERPEACDFPSCRIASLTPPV
jgi:hypothetical protein